VIVLLRKKNTYVAKEPMTTERLSDLVVIAMQSHFFHINRDEVCEKYVAMHPRRMMSASLLTINVVGIGIVRFCSIWISLLKNLIVLSFKLSCI
jgi:hypothetical protein